MCNRSSLQRKDASLLKILQYLLLTRRHLILVLSSQKSSTLNSNPESSSPLALNELPIFGDARRISGTLIKCDTDWLGVGLDVRVDMDIEQNCSWTDARVLCGE